MTADCKVARLASGEYLMSGGTGGGQILLYAGPGPAERVIGRRGEGPEEFGTDLDLIVGPGDTVFVIDQSNLRIVTVAPPGDIIGSFRLPGRVRSAAFLGSGNFLLHTLSSGSEPDPVLFHLVDRSGVELAGFGAPSQDTPDIDQWVVSPGHETGFWTVSGWRYELRQWDSHESLRAVYVREADWFPPDQVLPEDMYVRTPPPSWFTHVWEDSNGLVWTYSTVPDLDWRPAPPEAPTPSWTRRNLDTMVEVIDVRASRLVAQLRYDDVLAPVCGSGSMYTVIETPEGDTRAVVLEPSLVGAGM